MRRAACLLLAVLLGACSLPPVRVSPDGGAEAPARIEAWTVTGRIHIRAADEESWHATLYWRQDGDRYIIRLIAPLGQGTVELSGDPGHVTLRTTRGPPRAASDPESLMQDVLGWQVPVSGLRYWMLGQTVPDAPVTTQEVDARGRLSRLDQSGWSVLFQRYTEGPEAALPDRLWLRHERFTVRILVGQWERGRA